MVDGVSRTYALFRDHPHYRKVLDRYRISMFVRTSKLDKPLALELLWQIHPRHYNHRILTGLIRLFFAW